MRAIIQRVSNASCHVEDKLTGSIQLGLLVLLGIEEADDESDVTWLAGKIARMRIFKDEQKLMNLSLIDVKGDILLISQFTLHASTKKGNRPSFIKAARPEQAIPLYQKTITALESEIGKKVECGEFGGDMKISLTNDGPVTITIDSRNRE